MRARDAHVCGGAHSYVRVAGRVRGLGDGRRRRRRALPLGDARGGCARGRGGWEDGWRRRWVHMGRVASFRVECRGRFAAHGAARVARARVDDAGGPPA